MVRTLNQGHRDIYNGYTLQPDDMLITTMESFSDVENGKFNYAPPGIALTVLEQLEGFEYLVRDRQGNIYTLAENPETLLRLSIAKKKASINKFYHIFRFIGRFALFMFFVLTGVFLSFHFTRWLCVQHYVYVFPSIVEMINRIIRMGMQLCVCIIYVVSVSYILKEMFGLDDEVFQNFQANADGAVYEISTARKANFNLGDICTLLTSEFSMDGQNELVPGSIVEIADILPSEFSPEIYYRVKTMDGSMWPDEVKEKNLVLSDKYQLHVKYCKYLKLFSMGLISIAIVSFIVALTLTRYLFLWIPCVLICASYLCVLVALGLIISNRQKLRAAKIYQREKAQSASYV